MRAEAAVALWRVSGSPDRHVIENVAAGVIARPATLARACDVTRAHPRHATKATSAFKMPADFFRNGAGLFAAGAGEMIGDASPVGLGKGLMEF